MLSSEKIKETLLKVITPSPSQNVIEIKKNVKPFLPKPSLENRQSQLKQDNKKKEHMFFFPQGNHDTLFWCFYMLKHQEYNAYKNLNNINVVLEKEIKIKYIELLRQQKQRIKTYKIATISYIENMLANEYRIDIKTFMVLCLLENINITYLFKNSFFKIGFEEDEEDENEPQIKAFLIQKKNMETGFIKYGCILLDEKVSVEKTKGKELTQDLFHVENFAQPARAISHYTNGQLIEYLKNIKIYNSIHTLKKELYEDLVQYFKDM